MSISKAKASVSICIIFIISFSIFISPTTAFTTLIPSSKKSHLSNRSNVKELINEMSFYQDTNATPLLINGKISVVFIGGLFCPYCAMERWPIVLALKQFGNFTGLSSFNSSEDNIPTYNLTIARYSSATVDFQSVEIADNTAPPNQKPLQKMNTLESSLYT